jgi:hypothetical protein
MLGNFHIQNEKGLAMPPSPQHYDSISAVYKLQDNLWLWTEVLYNIMFGSQMPTKLVGLLKAFLNISQLVPDRTHCRSPVSTI